MTRTATLGRQGRRAARMASAPLRRIAIGARTRGWPPASRLFVVGDRGGWSVDEDAHHVAAAATRLGYEVAPPGWAAFASRQAVFHASHFEALTPRWTASSHRLALAYMHGRPGTPGAPEFDAAFAALRENADRFARVQVTHAEMHDLVLSAGVDSERVRRIPLGIDLEHFRLRSTNARASARARLGLPEAAFVVGSFQKDGVGWEDGLEPKLIKGPDLLLETLGRVRDEIADVYVLLTGPSRGYVRRGLEHRGIPYLHTTARSRAELARAYHALDVYLVTSRQEGGPKAVLESLATGVPLVTTRVGQAPDVVEDGRTGILVEVGDVDALATGVLRVRNDAALARTLSAAGRSTAESFALERLDPLWAGLLDGLVGRGAE